jgi:hypothetical protein
MTSKNILWVCLLIAVAAGCEAAKDPNASSTDEQGSENSVESKACTDLDLDGYGNGCAKGPDCDDRDPLRNLECGAERLGPCTSGTTQACYSMTYLADNKISCKSGTRTCVEGMWSKCDMTKTYTKKLSTYSAQRFSAITGPVQCNACDPACFMSSDTPDATEITAANSTDVTYDAISGGITVLPGGGGGGGGGGDPTVTDSDGDGVPDAYDQYPADAACDGYSEQGGACALPETNGGIFHVLEFGGPAVSNNLDIQTQVRTADIYFLMDTTQSMQGEINNLKSALTSGNYIADPTICPSLTPAEKQGIIGAMRCTIPDAQFGVGYFDDYPVAPYGSGGPNYDQNNNACADAPTGTSHDYPYVNLLTMSSDAAAVQGAVNKLVAKCGADAPESQLAALYSIGTGAPLPDNRSGFPKPACTSVPFVDTASAISEVIPGSTTHIPFSAYPSPMPTPTASQGDKQASAVSMGNISAGWVGFSGNTTAAGIANDYSGATYGCNSATAADVVYSFTVSTAGTYAFTTMGTTWNTTLILRDSSFNALAAPNNCNDNARGGVTWSTIIRTLNPGTYYIIVDGAANAAKGAFTLYAGPASGETRESAFDLGDVQNRTVRVTGNTTSMAHNESQAAGSCVSTATAADAVFKFTLTADTSLQMWNDAGTLNIARYLRRADGTLVDCTLDNFGYATNNLVAGTYYIVMDGEANTAVGTFDFSIGPADLKGDKPTDPYVMGDVTHTTKIVSGDTNPMTPDFDAATYHSSCDDAWEGPDAFLQFTVSETQDIAISMLSAPNGIHFSLFSDVGTFLGCETEFSTVYTGRNRVFRLTPGTYYVVVDTSMYMGLWGAPFQIAVGPAVGESRESAYDLGDLRGRWVSVCDMLGDENVRHRVDNYTGISCWGEKETTAADWYSPDAVYKFTLSETSNVFVTNTGGNPMIHQPILVPDGLMVQLRDSNFNPILCKDDDPYSALSLNAQLPAGTYYLLVQYGQAWTRGAVELHLGADWVPSATAPKYLVPEQTSCPAGTFGYPCFRDGTIPIVIAMTDAPMHQFFNWQYRYDDFGAPALPEALRALQQSGVKVIGINSGDDRSQTCAPECVATTPQNVCQNQTVCLGETQTRCRNTTTCSQGTCWTTQDCYSTCSGGSAIQNVCEIEDVCTAWGAVVCTDEPHTSDYPLRQLASATQATDENGNPFVYKINADGTGLDTSVVDAVNKLANYSRMDITLEVLDNPATAAVDERQFVKTVFTVPSAETNARCQTTHGTWFENCLPGTRAQFAVSFQNDFVPPAGSPEVFDFFIRTVGDGTYTLSNTPVRIVVPSGAGAGATYPAQGRYWREYSAACTGTQLPDWDDLSWVISALPAGTAIRFEIQTAATAAGLAAAPVVSVTSPPTNPPIDVGTALVAAGQANTYPHLKVTAVLLASPDRNRVPTLTSFDLKYRCSERD